MAHGPCNALFARGRYIIPEGSIPTADVNDPRSKMKAWMLKKVRPEQRDAVVREYMELRNEGYPDSDEVKAVCLKVHQCYSKP